MPTPLPEPSSDASGVFTGGHLSDIWGPSEVYWSQAWIELGKMGLHPKIDGGVRAGCRTTSEAVLGVRST